MTITPKTLAQLPTVETYLPEDVLLIIRNGLFHRLNELPQGIQGEPGLPGENGLPATFRRDGGFLQWKLSGEVDWINLVPLADITGDSGESIELQVTATHIQYRVVGDVDWINLIDLAALTGPQGEQGLQGEPGTGGSGSRILRVSQNDFINLGFALPDEYKNNSVHSVVDFGQFFQFSNVGGALDQGIDFVIDVLIGDGQLDFSGIAQFGGFSVLVDDTLFSGDDFQRIQVLYSAGDRIHVYNSTDLIVSSMSKNIAVNVSTTPH